MNKKLLEEKVNIKIKREVAQKLKVKAILEGMTREDYLEKIANEKTKEVRG
jgi:hypothetical protein